MSKEHLLSTCLAQCACVSATTSVLGKTWFSSANRRRLCTYTTGPHHPYQCSSTNGRRGGECCGGTTFITMGGKHSLCHHTSFGGCPLYPITYALCPNQRLSQHPSLISRPKNLCKVPRITCILYYFMSRITRRTKRYALHSSRIYNASMWRGYPRSVCNSMPFAKIRYCVMDGGKYRNIQPGSRFCYCLCSVACVLIIYTVYASFQSSYIYYVCKYCFFIGTTSCMGCRHGPSPFYVGNFTVWRGCIDISLVCGRTICPQKGFTLFSPSKKLVPRRPCRTIIIGDTCRLFYKDLILVIILLILFHIQYPYKNITMCTRICNDHYYTNFMEKKDISVTTHFGRLYTISYLYLYGTFYACVFHPSGKNVQNGCTRIEGGLVHTIFQKCLQRAYRYTSLSQKLTVYYATYRRQTTVILYNPYLIQSLSSTEYRNVYFGTILCTTYCSVPVYIDLSRSLQAVYYYQKLAFTMFMDCYYKKLPSTYQNNTNGYVLCVKFLDKGRFYQTN
uniref:p505_5R n=1 Tax=African swine fever virus TaxID=10497 RepID=A0A6G7KU42_ASF